MKSIAKVIFGCRKPDMSRDILEKEIAKKFGGQVTVASGAIHSDGDVRIDGFLVEAKRHLTKKSISVTNTVWKQIRNQALKRGRRPLVIFKNSELSVAILDLEDFKEMYEENKENKNETNSI